MSYPSPCTPRGSTEDQIWCLYVEFFCLIERLNADLDTIEERLTKLEGLKGA